MRARVKGQNYDVKVTNARINFTTRMETGFNFRNEFYHFFFFFFLEYRTVAMKIVTRNVAFREIVNALEKKREHSL